MSSRCRNERESALGPLRDPPHLLQFGGIGFSFSLVGRYVSPRPRCSVQELGPCGFAGFVHVTLQQVACCCSLTSLEQQMAPNGLLDQIGYSERLPGCGYLTPCPTFGSTLGQTPLLARKKRVPKPLLLAQGEMAAWSWNCRPQPLAACPFPASHTVLRAPALLDAAARRYCFVCRHSAAAAMIGDTLLIHGGVLDTGAVTSSMHGANLASLLIAFSSAQTLTCAKVASALLGSELFAWSSAWHQRATATGPVKGHTMALCNGECSAHTDGAVLLHGGLIGGQWDEVWRPLACTHCSLP